MRVIETSAGRGYKKLRIIVDLKADVAERYGLGPDVEVELVERADGLLVRRVKK